MSEFEKKNLNCDDYESLNAIWKEQLIAKGWQPAWGDEGPCWRSPDGTEAPSCYEAWAQATDTPTDLKLGVEKEPPVESYRKPV